MDRQSTVDCKYLLFLQDFFSRLKPKQYQKFYILKLDEFEVTYSIELALFKLKVGGDTDILLDFF